MIASVGNVRQFLQDNYYLAPGQIRMLMQKYRDLILESTRENREAEVVVKQIAKQEGLNAK